MAGATSFSTFSRPSLALGASTAKAAICWQVARSCIRRAARTALTFEGAIDREATPRPGEDQGQQRVAAGLATHADRLAGRATAVAGVTDHLQDGGLPRVEQRRQVAVQAVRRHRVLRQVIRADGREVHDRQELLGAQGGRGHLDHDADLGQAVASRLIREPRGFAGGGNHGGHHPQFRAGRLVGGREGLQLRVDEILTPLAQAQAAHAQGGVLLGTQIREAQRLVRASIQGAHDNATITEGLQDLRVGVRLLLQRGSVRAFQEQELGAEQARAPPGPPWKP